MWASEMCEEYTDAMTETDEAARRAGPVRGGLVIIDEGDLDIDMLVSLFE